MKLTAIFMLAAALHLAARSSGQNVTLSVKDAPMKEVFREIQRQTGLNVLINENILIKTGNVTLDVRDMPVSDVLNICLKNEELSYSIVDGTIVIKPKPVSYLAVDPSQLPKPIDIKGKIVDENGAPVPGVSVQVKGTKIGVTTDANGEFSLSGANEKSVLVISATNIEKQELKVGNKTSFYITATIKVTNLQEVVINKGYYSEKRRLSVGDVSIVKGEDIAKQPVLDPIQALEGRVPGLSIAQASGVPGAYANIQLRGINFIRASGFNTIPANDPLYVVDGVPFSSETLTSSIIGGGILSQSGSSLSNPAIAGLNTNGARLGMSPFSMLNPLDIEQIEVLKDADATAIYGAKGANGVILITTKKGKPGPLKVSLTMSAGSSKVARKMDMLDTKQFLAMQHEAFQNDGATGFIQANKRSYPYLTIWDTTRYTDWQKELIDRSALFSNIQLSVSGGSSQIQYSISGGFNRQGTTMPGDYSNKQASVLSNFRTASLNQRFHMDLSSFYSSTNSNLPQQNLGQYITLAPNAPAIYDANGNLNWETYQGSATWTNPLSYTLKQSNAVSQLLNSNLSISYQILKGIDISSIFGYSHAQMNQQNLKPANSVQPPYNTDPLSRSSQFSTSNTQSWNVEPQLTYNKKVGRSTLNAIIGATFRENKSNSLGYAASGFSSDDLISNPAAASNFSFWGYTVNAYRYTSVYSRIGYNWDEKYILNLTARRDGSTRFGPNNRFGNFGSAGVGWIFSKEKFIERGIPWISFGKLKANYGTVGGDYIGDYQYFNNYSVATGDGSAYQSVQTLSPNGHANPYIAWQVNKKLEFGTELGFLNDRINLTASYYCNRSGNQLVAYPLPGFTGFANVVENLNAVVQNTGWEFTLNSVNYITRDIRWTSSFNLSISRNKLISFPGLEKTGFAAQYSVGEPITSILVYHYIGVDPQTGVYSFATKNGTGIPNPTTDRIWSKSLAFPSYYGGFDNTIGYRGFSIDLFFQFVKQIAYNVVGAAGMPGYGGSNQPTTVLESWQKPGDITNIQKYSSGLDNKSLSAFNIFSRSDGILTDASFIRLKNIALSYQLPQSIVRKSHLQQFRIFIQCQNLFTITSYKGLDPETQGLSLPPMRTITGGINITL